VDSSPTTQTTSNEIIHKNSKHMEHKNKYENMKKKQKERKKYLCVGTISKGVGKKQEM
jgi:hypothetical protein